MLTVGIWTQLARDSLGLLIRWCFQLFCMLGDLALIAATLYLIVAIPLDPIIWIIILLAGKVWLDQGGFFAWKPANIRAFISHAREYGL